MGKRYVMLSNENAPPISRFSDSTSNISGAKDSTSNGSPSSKPAAIPRCVSDPRRLVLFVGKGGVGKTTCACATALALAERGRRVLLLSTDPAHSVSDVQAGQTRGITVDELDATAATDRFRETHGATLQDIVSRGTLFAEDDIAELLELAFPGMDEVMAFLRIADLLNPDAPDSERYDTVVVDTAPFGHTLRLLDMPTRFSAWLDVLDAMLNKHRYMRSVFGSGGSDPLDAFLDDMYDRVARVDEALRAPTVSETVVVTRPEPVIAAETRRILSALRDRSMPVRTLVVNAVPVGHARPLSLGIDSEGGVRPEPLQVLAVPPLPELTETEEAERAHILHSLWEHAREWSPEEKGRAENASADTAPLENVPADVSEPVAPTIHVENPAPLPSARVVMVAGKGGVGKTTMAAATALEMARRDPGVLLASTDPAHSLRDVVGGESEVRGNEVGGNELRGDEVRGKDSAVRGDAWRVVDGVDAVEIDAEARFRELHDAYADEVSAFFDRTGGPNVDLVYERSVAEKLIGIAPPGIDEVMGWMAVMEFLENSRYHTGVIDTAPTGHFLQLLSMPELFSTWIRTFFRILRRHRDVLHLPELSDRLVRLSKRTKRWQRWGEEGAVKVVGVAVPEPVVQAETLRLIRQIRDHGPALAVLVMNRVTPESERSPAETAVLDMCRTELETVSPPPPMPHVIESGVLNRVDRLQQLGRTLWGRTKIP